MSELGEGNRRLRRLRKQQENKHVFYSNLIKSPSGSNKREREESRSQQRLLFFLFWSSHSTSMRFCCRWLRALQVCSTAPFSLKSLLCVGAQQLLYSIRHFFVYFLLLCCCCIKGIRRFCKFWLDDYDVRRNRGDRTLLKTKSRRPFVNRPAKSLNRICNSGRFVKPGIQPSFFNTAQLLHAVKTLQDTRCKSISFFFVLLRNRVYFFAAISELFLN